MIRLYGLNAKRWFDKRSRTFCVDIISPIVYADIQVAIDADSIDATILSLREYVHDAPLVAKLANLLLSLDVRTRPSKAVHIFLCNGGCFFFCNPMFGKRIIGQNVNFIPRDAWAITRFLLTQHFLLMLKRQNDKKMYKNATMIPTTNNN